MHLDGAWELLLGIKLLAQQLGKHFVNSDICEEQVVVLEKLSFVFELSEVSLQPIEPNNFCDAWKIKVCNLFPKF